MNPRRLRQNLRAGGWAEHGRNLPSYLLRHGLPCWRDAAGRRLRFGLDARGGLEARLPDGQLVCTESAVALHLEQVPAERPEPLALHWNLFVSEELADRTARAAAATGLSRSELIRAALRLWLEVRGYAPQKWENPR